jgi:hypothetical protein
MVLNLNELSTMDAVAQAELVRRREVTPVELVDAAIARIEKVNPTLNAVIHKHFERARAQSAGKLPEGPSRGVPFLLKDLAGGNEPSPRAGCVTKFMVQNLLGIPRTSREIQTTVAPAFCAMPTIEHPAPRISSRSSSKRAWSSSDEPMYPNSVPGRRQNLRLTVQRETRGIPRARAAGRVADRRPRLHRTWFPLRTRATVVVRSESQQVSADS